MADHRVVKRSDEAWVGGIIGAGRHCVAYQVAHPPVKRQSPSVYSPDRAEYACFGDRACDGAIGPTWIGTVNNAGESALILREDL
jgi:hypothetical protein